MSKDGDLSGQYEVTAESIESTSSRFTFAPPSTRRCKHSPQRSGRDRGGRVVNLKQLMMILELRSRVYRRSASAVETTARPFAAEGTNRL